MTTRLKGITILKGIEVDILKDGSLGLLAKALAALDVVVPPVHRHLDLPRDAGACRTGMFASSAIPLPG